jgi:hypothetical protein
MKRALLAPFALAVAVACGGNPPRPEGAAVVIKESHFHTISQHRHGVDCGHELIDGVWTLPLD